MSHHGESPLARQHPQLDICDFYAFGGGQGRTVLVQTCCPASGPRGFASGGQYAWHVDLDGDARADQTYRVTFGRPGADGRQLLRLEFLAGEDGHDPAARGEVLAAGRTGETAAGAGARVWAGRRADPFWIDERRLSAVAGAFRDGSPLDLEALAGEQAANRFAGQEVNALVAEIPPDLLPAGGRQAGFWATASVRMHGTWRQVQRCGLPLVPSLVYGPDSEDASAWQAGAPHQDRALYGDLVAARAARLAGSTHPAGMTPDEHGARVRDILLPDLLPYEPGSTAGFDTGRINGRGLAHPSAKVVLSIVAGRAVPLGIGPESAPPPLPGFPFLAPPAGGVQ